MKKQIWQDEIIEEIHRVRDAYASRFNYDIAAMVADAQERQHQSGRELVTLPPKRFEQPYATEEQPKAA